MEAWSEGDVQALLGEGEELEVAFPVRYPRGKLPFGVLLSGCVIALTDRRVTAFAYHKATSKPAEEIWSESRTSGCTAALSDDARVLTLVRPHGETRRLAVAPRHTARIRRLIDALTA